VSIHIDWSVTSPNQPLAPNSPAWIDQKSIEPARSTKLKYVNDMFHVRVNRFQMHDKIRSSSQEVFLRAMRFIKIKKMRDV